MLKINNKVHPKMLQNFDSQQFPDFTIITSNGKIMLVLAYLSIDSAFFQNISDNQVDLSYLPQNPLIRVLKSLYGDQLIAYSVQDLQQLFLIIQQLRIEQYKQTIVKQISQNTQLINNLQILQFCFKNGLMVENIKKYHFQNNLKSLEDNKNFLLLNKISTHTLIVILAEFHDQLGQDSVPIINGILQNYLNRNNIKAVNFFQEEGTQNLQSIWEKFHHSVYTDKTAKQKKTQPLQASINDMINPKPNNEQIMIDKKNKRQKDKIIEKLRKQLCSIKKQNSRLNRIKTPKRNNIDQEDDIQLSILQGLKNINKSKSKKDDLNLSQRQTAFHKSSQKKQPTKINRTNNYHKIHRT